VEGGKVGGQPTAMATVIWLYYTRWRREPIDDLAMRIAQTPLPVSENGEAVRLLESELQARLVASRFTETAAVEPWPVISPELALIDPELRALALARLPRRDPDGFVPAARPVSTVVTAVLSDDPVSSGRTQGRELAIGVLAYTLQRTASFAVEGAALVGGVAGLALLLDWVR
jgi:hypothetical protein